MNPKRGTGHRGPKVGDGGTAKRTPPDSGADVSTTGEPANKLTADEQMALYEKELKENDWGHQPC